MNSSCKGNYVPHKEHPSRDMDDNPKSMKSLAKKKKRKINEMDTLEQL